MAEKDRELLSLIGLSVPQAALLFGRSRQALSKGINRPEPYFKTAELTMLMQKAKSKSLESIGQISEYVEQNYAGTDADLSIVLPYEAAIRAALFAINKADQVILVFHGHIDELPLQKVFIRVVSEAVEKNRSKIDFVFSDARLTEQMRRWSIAPIRQHLLDLIFCPPILIAVSQWGHRSFVFTQRSVEELAPLDAKRMWTENVSRVGVKSRIPNHADRVIQLKV